jgi:hypothetical protein
MNLRYEYVICNNTLAIQMFGEITESIAAKLRRISNLPIGVTGIDSRYSTIKKLFHVDNIVLPERGNYSGQVKVKPSVLLLETPERIQTYLGRIQTAFDLLNCQIAKILAEEPDVTAGSNPILINQ